MHSKTSDNERIKEAAALAATIEVLAKKDDSSTTDRQQQMFEHYLIPANASIRIHVISKGTSSDKRKSFRPFAYCFGVGHAFQAYCYTLLKIRPT